MATSLEVNPPQSKKLFGTAAPATAARVEPIVLRKIAALIDGSPYSEQVLMHAVRAAAALDAELTLLRVIEPRAPTLLDPVAFDLRVREAREEVDRLAEEGSTGGRRVKTAVIEGDAAEQIRQWVRDNDIDLTVLGTHGDRGVTDWGLGSTARKLLDSVPGSLFLIPADRRPAGRGPYRTVLVPLDGSSHAESVLPLANRFAADAGRRVVLAHIVPVPELTETAPMENEARELRERLVRRNRRVADEYLERIRAHADGNVEVRATSEIADVRTGLAAIIDDERPDLVVLSAYGRGRRMDVPFGSVAAHLIGRASVPLLIVRGRRSAPARAAAAPIRLPVQAGK
jgi:nucleotide-binding universal stress UspA family protein